MQPNVIFLKVSSAELVAYVVYTSVNRISILLKPKRRRAAAKNASDQEVRVVHCCSSKCQYERRGIPCLAGKHVRSRRRVSPAVEQGDSLTSGLARTEISFGKIRYSVSESTDQSIDHHSSVALKRSSRPDAE